MNLGFYRASRTRTRYIRPSDADAVMAIEEASFPEPWDASYFSSVLDDPDTLGMVAEQRGSVVGYIVVQLDGHFYRIVSMAVHPSRRRQSIGTLLVAKFTEMADRGVRRTLVSAMVVEGNDDACQFFCDQGFRAYAIVRDYFEQQDGTTKDGYRFVWEGQR